MTRGIVYSLDGENENCVGDGTTDYFLKEVLISADSVKRRNPNLPITIFTNKHENLLHDSGYFESILPCLVDSHTRPYINKIAACLNSPYDETLYLDCDTYVLVSLENVYAKGFESYNDTGDLFSILDSFDMAFCLESLGAAKGETHPTIPDTFSRFNTGVMLFKKNKKTKEFLTDWFESYRDSTNFDPSKHDQWQFRLSLWNSDIRYCTLDHAYNQRFYTETGAAGDGSHLVKTPYWRHHPNNPGMFWDYVNKMNYSNPFKIVHDRLLMHNLDKWYNGKYYNI